MVLTGVGAAVSAIGGVQQARAQQAIGEENARIQAQNANLQAAAARAQAEITRKQADANFQLRAGTAAQATANANAMRERAAAQDAINARNIRLKRDEGERLQASQRAKFAAAGLVESTGSPLSILAETAGLIQRDISEQTYINELNQAGLLQEAALERLGGRYALAGAMLDRSAGRSESALRAAGAEASLLSGLRSAEVTRLAGNAAAQGSMFGAFGNLLGSASSIYGNYRELKKYGAFS